MVENGDLIGETQIDANLTAAEEAVSGDRAILITGPADAPREGTS